MMNKGIRKFKIIGLGEKYPYSDKLRKEHELIFGECIYSVDKKWIYNPMDIMFTAENRKKENKQ